MTAREIALEPRGIVLKFRAPVDFRRDAGDAAGPGSEIQETGARDDGAAQDEFCTAEPSVYQVLLHEAQTTAATLLRVVNVSANVRLAVLFVGARLYQYVTGPAIVTGQCEVHSGCIVACALTVITDAFITVCDASACEE